MLDKCDDSGVFYEEDEPVAQGGFANGERRMYVLASPDEVSRGTQNLVPWQGRWYHCYRDPLDISDE